MEKHKKHVKHAHKNWAGIFAAAFAVAIVVATQFGGVDTSNFKADMASDCAAAGGTFMGEGANPPCQMPQQDPGVACANSGGTWNGTMCNMPSQTTCSSGQYWNGSACVNNATPTCPSGQNWNGSMCANNTTTTCPSGQNWNGSMCITNVNATDAQMAECNAKTPVGSYWWDGVTNTCKASTMPTCTSPMYLDSATNTCKSPTGTTNGAATYVTEPTCNGAAYFWSWSKNMCYSTQADKTAAEAATGTANTCSGGQYWNGSYCQADTMGACSARGGQWIASGTNGACSITPTPGTTYTGPSGANKYVTEPTCASAGYFWGSKSRWCYNTSNELNMAENSTNTTTCSAGMYWIDGMCKADTVGACTARKGADGKAGVWTAANSTCSVPPTAANTGAGTGTTNYTPEMKAECEKYNGVGTWDPTKTPPCTSNYTVTDTVGACTARKGADGKNGVWNATNSSCSVPMGYSNTTTTNSNWTKTTWNFKDGQSSESYILNRTDSEYANYIARVRAACLLVNKTYNWNPGAGNDTDWRNFGIPDCSGTAPATVDTVDGCRDRGMGWDAANSRCIPRTDTEWNDMPPAEMPERCRKAGGVWMPGVSGGSATTAMRSGYCKMSDNDYMPVDTIGSCEKRGMGWDAERSMCSGYKNVQTEWDMPAGICPDGTSYKAGRYSRENPPCSMENTRAMGMEDGCWDVGGTWVKGADAATSTRVATTGYCRMPVDNKAIKETNSRMKAECVARKGTWNPGPTETATGWCRMAQKFIEPEMEDCGEDGYWDFNLQSCQTRETEDMFRGDREDRESMRMMAMFKNQLAYISRDIDQVGQRADEMTENGVDTAEAQDYLDRAYAIVTKMMENPADLVAAEDPRTLFEPACMRVPMMRNSSFNAGPQRMCSIEEALKGDTPRGYIYAANMILEEARNHSWETKKCENLSNHLAEAQRMFAKARNKAEVDALLVEGNGLVSRCDAGEDIDAAMEGLRIRFEELMRRSSKKTIDPSYGLRFSGVDQRMDQETFDRIVALRVNEEISARLKQVIDERISELATHMDAPTLAKVTSVLTSVKQEISDQLAVSFENAAVFAKRAPDAVNRQQGYVVDTINTLKTIETVYPRSAGQVEKVRVIIASRPWPSAILSGWNDTIARALAVANTNSDPTKILGEILSQAGETDEEEVNRKLTDEGLWASPYLRHDVWYAGPVNEAYTRRVMEGTVDAEGNRDFRPEVPLNCIEGTAMIYKAAGRAEPTEVGEFARGLAGKIEWGGSFIEGTAAIIGEDEMRGVLVDKCGGVGEPMRREVFAHLVVQMYEKLTGKEVRVDVDQEIANWVDKDRLGDYKLDLAKAHKLGVIMGADGGILANPKGVANRAEAAKMLTAFNKALETLGVLATADFPNPTGSDEAFPTPDNS